MRRSDSGSRRESLAVTDATELRVRYGDTDAMGWVYYATYLTYFEVGRTELIRKVWRSYRDIEEHGLRLPVIEAGCRYHQGACYDDVLKIESRMTLPSSVRVRFDYHVIRLDDRRLLAEGFTEHCFVSEAGKPVRIPMELKARIES